MTRLAFAGALLAALVLAQDCQAQSLFGGGSGGGGGGAGGGGAGGGGGLGNTGTGGGTGGAGGASGLGAGQAGGSLLQNEGGISGLIGNSGVAGAQGAVLGGAVNNATGGAAAGGAAAGGAGARGGGAAGNVYTQLANQRNQQARGGAGGRAGGVGAGGRNTLGATNTRPLPVPQIQLAISMPFVPAPEMAANINSRLASVSALNGSPLQNISIAAGGNGTIRLSGIVNSESDRRIMEMYAGLEPGVYNVINDLQVASPLP